MSLVPKPDKDIKEKKTTDQLPLWPLKQLSLTNNSKNNPIKMDKSLKWKPCKGKYMNGQGALGKH